VTRSGNEVTEVHDLAIYQLDGNDGDGNRDTIRSQLFASLFHSRHCYWAWRFGFRSHFVSRSLDTH
jgi:hypothetical protein